MRCPLLRCPVHATVRALACCGVMYCSQGAALACQAATAGDARATETPPVGAVAKAAADAPLPPFRVRISDARIGIAAMQALALAAARLARPSCQGILTEFTDDTGRPLAHRLAALRLSAEAYLRLMVVVDGSRLASMLGDGCPGFHDAGQSRRIPVRRIVRDEASGQSRRKRRPMIIHELLHSLGLGENPPTTEAISRRVRQRCW